MIDWFLTQSKLRRNAEKPHSAQSVRAEGWSQDRYLTPLYKELPPILSWKTPSLPAILSGINTSWLTFITRLKTFPNYPGQDSQAAAWQWCVTEGIGTQLITHLAKHRMDTSGCRYPSCYASHYLFTKSLNWFISFPPPVIWQPGVSAAASFRLTR